MEEEKNMIIEEVLDEIESALKDSRGLGIHQKRIAFSVSLGAVFLIESYLKKLNVFKSGGKIDHRWLKKKKENAKKFIANQIICPINNLKDFDKILDIAYEIENKRNNVVYGRPISEKILRDYINLFFKLREIVKNA